MLIQDRVALHSKPCEEMHGNAENDMHVSPDEFGRRTHPDDAAQMQQDRQAQFDSLSPTHGNEHRVPCKYGSWKWFLTRYMVISRDAGNRPLRMVDTDTDTDITHRNARRLGHWSGSR